MEINIEAQKKYWETGANSDLAANTLSGQRRL